MRDEFTKPPLNDTLGVGTVLPVVVRGFDQKHGSWEVSHRVIWTSPYGVHCRLDNRVIGFIHKTSVIGPISEDLSKYLKPGDVVEVKVVDTIDQARGTQKVEFVRVIDQFAETNTREDSELLELRAIRRAGARGCFSREASFRWNALDAYDHRCCICGERFVIGEASAMEAAHVIPRGNRGSNTLANALCLCPVHHWAFDKGMLTIDEEFQVRVASATQRRADEVAWLAKLDGQAAALAADAPISRAALAWHRRNIFLDR